jgi:flagellar biosynthesis component FlhA
VGLSVAPELPARMARVSIHGLPEKFIELAEYESLEAIAQLLDTVCRTRAEALLTLDATGALLDELQGQAPVVVRQAHDRLGLPTIHGVLKGLLREQVPIRDLTGLLEALLLVAPGEQSAPVLVEHARRSQAHAIGLKLADDHGTITAVELGSGWDEVLAGFTSWDTGLAADWTAGRSLAEAVHAATAKAIEAGLKPVLLVPRRYRPLVAEALRAHGGTLPVLAPDEVSARFNLRLAGSVPRPAEALVR